MAATSPASIASHIYRADYASFWSTLDSGDLYADIIAHVSGFGELMRMCIAVTVSQVVQDVERAILKNWLNRQGKELEDFVGNV